MNIIRREDACKNDFFDFSKKRCIIKNFFWNQKIFILILDILRIKVASITFFLSPGLGLKVLALRCHLKMIQKIKNNCLQIWIIIQKKKTNITNYLTLIILGKILYYRRVSEMTNNDASLCKKKRFFMFFV